MSNQKVEDELSQHIKKVLPFINSIHIINQALTPDESAPKQKHVRACIVYTWDIKSSGSFWAVLKNQPILGEEIMSFKALITFHKVIKDGHPFVLKDALSERAWLETLARGTQIMTNKGGYSALIREYVQYLSAKLVFHKIHPSFNGSFDYEEYLTLRGVEDPNEGYETISELLDLANKIDTFQKFVFHNLRPGVNNECRIAALVPLVEESYGIYQFLTFMLTAMHQIIGSIEVLAPLRERFNVSHYALFKFYNECSTIRYLTTLITIPTLTQNPPDLLAKGNPTKQPKRALPEQPSPNALDDIDIDEQQRMMAVYQQQQMDKNSEKDRQTDELMRRQNQEQQDMMQRQRMEEERQRQIQMQQQQYQSNQNQMDNQMIQQRALEMQREVDGYRNQSANDRRLAEEIQSRMMALQNQLDQMTFQEQSNSNRFVQLQQIQDDLSQWKQKYEALAKLYAQLRKEHLDLLTKSKEYKDLNSKLGDDHRREMDNLRNETRSKLNEQSDILLERNRTRDELARVRVQYEDEFNRLRKELDISTISMSNISNAKGNEVQLLVQQHNSEKERFEREVKNKQQMIDDLASELALVKDNLSKSNRNNDEDLIVLQTGLDQTLLAYDQLQKSSYENESKLMSQMNQSEMEHLSQLNRMIDNIIESCIIKIDDSMYEFESPVHLGNQSASVEYVLSLLERCQNTCVDLAQSFVRLIQGGDQIESINTSNAFAYAITQLLHSAKGLTRFAADDDSVDLLVSTVLSGSTAARYYFSKLVTSSLGQIDEPSRPQFIINLCKQTQHNINSMTSIFEKLIQSENQSSVTNVEDMSLLVESEMRNAAYAVEKASKKIDELLSKDLNVHVQILNAAKSLTSVVTMLIIRATESQLEIVNLSKGTTSPAAFYKKNNKWTEGLISAAKFVAVATTYLVECADGLINDTHSMEQLIVSAQEVLVSTTQLVSASRVKSVPYSKTQNRLEEAAVGVRDATKVLVRAAKDASKSSDESQTNTEAQALGRHQYKVVEMEQQVKILEIEKELQNARYKLGSIRKMGYEDK